MPVELPCMCAGIRRASRALTQMYDDSLRPSRAACDAILDPASPGAGGKGWITVRAGADRRERWLRLAPLGGRELQRATPAWERVQKRLQHKLGDARWRDLRKLSSAIGDIVANSRMEGASNEN